MNDHLDGAYPRQLVDSIANRRCVLLVGSGISRHAAGLPLWDEFVCEVFQKVVGEHEASDDEILAYRLEALEHARTHDNLAYENKIREILRPDLESGMPSALHRNLAEMPWVAIITTNLDTLLERALTTAHIEHIPIAREEDIARIALEKNTPLIKMHGSIEHLANAVLTADAYLQFDSERDAMKALVLSLYAQYPVLMLGAGLQDENFIRINHRRNRALGINGQKVFHVNSGVPPFVKAVWQQRRMEFIDVDHEHLADWLSGLRQRVENKRRSLLSDQTASFVERFCKSVALENLAGSLDDYGALQCMYLAGIQMPDYGLFGESWERTLYSGLRNLLVHALNEVQGNRGTKLLYCGPGPHAPALTINPLRTGTFSKIHCVDIAQSVAKGAADTIADKYPDAKAEPHAIDLSQGVGSAFCDELHGAISASANLNQLFRRLGDPEEFCGRVLARRDYRREDEPALKQVDIAYSEMVGSFTLTAPLMAFRSAVYQRLQNEPAHEGAARDALDRLASAWRSLNELVYKEHVEWLAERVRPGGYVLIAVDSVKEFDDKNSANIDSFHNGRMPKLNIAGLERRHLVTPGQLHWRDHDYYVDARVFGIPVDDFKPHQHLVHLISYAKT